MVSFESAFTTYTPDAFPVLGSPMIAPFWADANLNLGGNIWFRESHNPDLLDRASQDIQKLLGGTHVCLVVHWLFIVTWKDVVWFGYVSGTSNDYVSMANIKK